MDTLILYRDWADTTGLDLSNWVDVDQGGINPGDADTRSGVFLAGAVAAGVGAPLIGEARANRVVAVNLLVDATSRDGLHAAFHGIEQRLQGTAPLLAWTPDGATLPTYFRVLYGRLLGSDRYDTRREATFHARRLLECVCLPWGEGVRRTSSSMEPQTFYPSINGAAASGALPSNPACFPVPSVGGDRPAAARIIFGTASSVGSALPSSGASTGKFPWGSIQAFAWGLTPDGSFNPAAWRFGTPTTLTLTSVGTSAGPTTVLTDPWIPGGAAAQFSGTALGSAGAVKPWKQIAASAYKGPDGVYRVFAVARCRSDVAGWGRMWLSDRRRSSVATMFGAPSSFLAYDMGEFDTAKVRWPVWNIFFERGTGASFTASPAFNLAEIVMVPVSWGGGLWRNVEATTVRGTNNGATSLLTAIDGLEPERGITLSWPAYGSGAGGSGWGQMPVASNNTFATTDTYRGDSPEIPYQPSNGSAVTPSHMHMVVYAMKHVESPGWVGSGGYTQTDQDRVRVVLVTQPRYTFAR